MQRPSLRTWIVSVLLVLIGGWGYFVWSWFNGPRYSMAMLKWHGKETKDGSKQLYYANRIIAAGDDALPVLTEEIEASLWYRYEPTAREMLRSIPAGEQHLLDRLAVSCDGNEAAVLNVQFVLMEVYDRWDLLPEFCQRYANFRGPGIIHDMVGNAMWGLVKRTFPTAPPFARTSDFEITPEFLQWVKVREAKE